MSFRSLSLPVMSVSLLGCMLAVPAIRAQQSSSSSQVGPGQNPAAQTGQEREPAIVDPAGPTISLVSSEQVFIMAATLNACGYNEGLDQSTPVRAQVREEMNQVLAKSEDARTKRDKVCLFIAQHRMTGTAKDIAQYISLALYLTPPPALETTAELPQMPPDSTQVVEILPLLRAFAAAVDLHGIWLTVHPIYDEQINRLHDPLSKMIVSTNLYLKMPASAYEGRRFIVVVESMLSPSLVNARVYGADYVVVVSPSTDGDIRMTDVRHTYLHYVIEPLLYSRTNAMDRMQSIMKEVRDAPLEFHYRNSITAFVVECLIKAIEARTMDTGIPVYKIPTDINRSELPRYEHERQVTLDKMEAVRVATVKHDMAQGFVLTQYFYEQLLQFEKQPSGLKDTIGEMVYGMDIDQQVHRARDTDFDQTADGDVLQRSGPRVLEGLDLAEARLEAGDTADAIKLAHKVLASKGDSPDDVADQARAHFILARTDLMTGHPEDAINNFQQTIATSKEPRLLAWSHIYLGRMLDLSCKRNEALAEYKLALDNRDGAQDTRLAAERGVKAPYAVNGHSCEDDSDDAPPPSGKPASPGDAPGAPAPQ
ncbi:MAG TPA: tetratricopeptide repeat protein [Terracidiphilus sp.]|nr:tetratricopeptide repeat protein [Terracidiphilus sp.]